MTHGIAPPPWELVRELTVKDAPKQTRAFTKVDQREWLDGRNIERLTTLVDWLQAFTLWEASGSHDFIEPLVREQQRLMRPEELSILVRCLDSPTERNSLIGSLLRSGPSQPCLEAIAHIIENNGLNPRSFTKERKGYSPLRAEQIGWVKEREQVIAVLSSNYGHGTSSDAISRRATAVVAYTHGMAPHDVTKAVKAVKDNVTANAIFRWSLPFTLTRFD